MLLNERYNHAIRSFAQIDTTYHEPYPDDREMLLVEQYRTQTALEFFGINSNLPSPSHLPSINEIFFPELTDADREKITASSIIGMPNGGKTTTINTMIESREYENPPIVGEVYRQEKEKLDQQGKFDFETLLTNVLFRQYPEYLYALQRTRMLNEIGLNMETVSLFDRLCWTDMPMIRTHFLMGNIRSKVLSDYDKFFFDRMISRNIFANNVVISALILPKLSLKRQGPDESSGRIMNLPFLNVLYEQYLRFHYEMIHFEKVYKRKRTFTYCATDMSSIDSYERFRSLEKVINWAHIGLCGTFTPESINMLIKTDF